MYNPIYISGPIKAALIKYPKAESVAVHLRIKAGSNYETRDNVGAAHMLEHLCTKNPSLVSGAYGNGKLYGVTSRDNILFLIVGVKKDWHKFIDFLRLIIEYRQFTETDLQKQKLIISQEINRYKSIPEKYITRISYKNIFPNSRMAILNSGDVAEINSLTLRKIQEFADKSFVRSRMSIVLAGNLNESDVTKHLHKAFSDVRVRGSQTHVILKPNTNFDIQFQCNELNEPSHIKISFIGRRLNHIKRHINDILAHIIKNKLIFELRDKHALTYRVTCESLSSDTFGVLSVYFTVVEKQIVAAVKHVKSIVNENCITEESLHLAKNEILLDYTLNFEKTSIAADFYSEHLLYGNNKITYSGLLSEVAKTKLSQVLKEAKYTFSQQPKMTVLTKSFNTDHLKQDIKQIWNPT